MTDFLDLMRNSKHIFSQGTIIPDFYQKQRKCTKFPYADGCFYRYARKFSTAKYVFHLLNDFKKFHFFPRPCFNWDSDVAASLGRYETPRLIKLMRNCALGWTSSLQSLLVLALSSFSMYCLVSLLIQPPPWISIFCPFSLFPCHAEPNFFSRTINSWISNLSP